MAIERYYVERRDEANKDLLTITAPAPWTWARVRGCTARGTRLANISFTGGRNTALLLVRVTGTDTELVGSRYEIIVGDANTRADDAELRVPGQLPIYRANVTLLGDGYLKWLTDPPPPPFSFDWDFEPTDNIE